ncbi:MAG: hypothetical protein N2517_06750 [Ignavibacteria bacterium]|nr:hypothetical protein [Ignavibacteria bacterium]
MKHFLIPAVFFLLLNFNILGEDYNWIVIDNVRNLNSRKDDFAPQWNQYDNRLYFTSLKDGKSKFFTSKLKERYIFDNPIELADPLNRTNRGVSYITFISETEALVNSFRIGKRQAFLNIFHTQRRTGQWQSPVLLDSLQCECFVLHPSISPNGRELIFSSDAGASNGNLDLFVAFKLDNGAWSVVSKIEELNTEGNEITPFFVGSDTLYFASDGYGGPGGFDLFFSVRRGHKWGKPMPLTTLNTRFNESDFALIDDTTAIFASDRPEGVGGLDLYLARKVPAITEINFTVRPLELSLATQIPFLSVELETKYDLLQFPQTLDLDTEVENSHQRATSADSREFYPKKILELTFATLSERLKTRKAKVVISFDTSNPSLYEKLTYLINQIEDSNFSNQIIFNPKSSNTLSFYSEDTSLFEPIKIFTHNYIIEPTALEISILVRPSELLSHWFFHIQGTMIQRKGSNPSEFLRVELSPDSLGKAILIDTLFLNLTAYDTLNRKFTSNYPILVNVSETKLRNKIKYKGRNFERNFLIVEPKNFEFSSSYFQFLNELSVYRDFYRSLVILSKNKSDLPTLNKVLVQINSKLLLPKEKCTIETDVTEYEKLYGKIPENIVVLLLERK